MVEEALTGLEILVVLNADEQAYVRELHAALDSRNTVKDCSDVNELMAELQKVRDRHKTLIVACLSAAAELASIGGNPVSDIPMLVIAPPGHVDEYTEAMKAHHGRFEYLNKVDSPDPQKLLRTLALIAKDGPVGVGL